MSSITHTFVCGATRSGKSEAELSRLVPLVRAGDCAIVLLDPPGSLAAKFLLHLDMLGLTRRVLYDRFCDTDRVPGYDWLSPSRHPDPLQREAENDEAVREFAAILLRRRGVQDMATTPLIEEGILAALRLYLHQRTPAPLAWLGDLFSLGSEVRHFLLQNCTEPELVRKFETWARLSPTARRTETGPAERVLKAVCESPAFRVRSNGATFDFDRFLDERGILILDGSSQGNLSRDATVVMMGAVILHVIRHCRTGGKSRVVLVLDEAVNANLIGVHESRALAEAGKWGLEFHVIVQDPFNFPSEEIRNNVLQNCWRHEWFRQGSPDAARLAAEDLATPLLDPLKVHHTEYHIRTVDAGYDRVRTESRTERTDLDGKATGQSKSWSTVLWPRRREVKDKQDRYMTLSDQVTLMQKELMCLRPGYRFVRLDFVLPQTEYVPLLRHFGSEFGEEGNSIARVAARRLQEIKFNASLRAVKERPWFQSPESVLAVHESSENREGAAKRIGMLGQ